MSAIRSAIQQFNEGLSTDPGGSRATLTVECRLQDGTATEASVGKHTVNYDEPKFLGGGGTAPTPVAHALATLGSCEAIGYRIWSEMLDIPFDSVTVVVEGDLDLRGAFSGTAEPGFQSVRMSVFLAGSEPGARYAELERAVETHSPILALFREQVPVETTLNLASVG